MQFAALLWHIRTLTDQPIALGLVGLARFVPIILFSLPAGALADVVDRRRILLVTQVVQTAVATALGWLTITGEIQLWHIYALSSVDAAMVAFGLPARQSLTPNLVPARDLPNAFSMQSIAFNTGSILGPVLAGVVLATPALGQPYTYFINAVSYLALIWAVVAMGPVEQKFDAQRRAGVSLGAIREGVAYIVKQPIILSSMVLDFIATFFSSATALLPIYAQDILRIGEVGYGWLSAAEFIGAGVAGAVISQLSEIRRQGRILLAAVAIYGLSTILFGLATSFPVAMLALMGVGGADTVSAIIRNTIRQLQTPDHIRGRMTSINQMFFIGGPQLGEIEAGAVAQAFGPVASVVSGGVACLLSLAWVVRKWPQIARYSGQEAIAAGAAAD